jgi:hypothetical protein
VDQASEELSQLSDEKKVQKRQTMRFKCVNPTQTIEPKSSPSATLASVSKKVKQNRCLEMTVQFREEVLRKKSKQTDRRTSANELGLFAKRARTDRKLI